MAGILLKSKEPYDYSQRKVLVVDDFGNVRKSIKGMLANLGVSQVIEAANATQAALAIQNENFDVVICDYNLGPGRDGQQLLEEMRFKKKLSYLTTFVLITAETSRDMVLGALEFQPDDYFAKPFAFETLKQRMHRWFERQKSIESALKAMDGGDNERIIEACDDISKNQPRYKSWAEKQLIQTLVDEGQYEKAESLIEKVNLKRVQAWAKFEQARIFYLQGEFESAIEILKELTISDPNLVQAFDLLSKCYEHQKDTKSAQNSLVKGVERSPRNISRQVNLGNISLKLDDHKTAAKAFKDVVSLSDATMHEKPQNFEKLIRSMHDLSDNEEDERLKRKYNKEASSHLKNFSKKYSDNAEAKLFSKIYHYKLDEEPNNKQLADDKLTAFVELAKSIIENMNLDVGVDLAQLLYKNERFNDADQLVNQLRKIHKTDGYGVKKLNALQSEPIPKDKRIKAHKLNVKACKLYEKQEFRNASDIFVNALNLSPRHPGMILNYIQSNLKLLKEDKTPKETLADCESMIERLDFLDDEHYQFDRYSAIKNKISQLQERFNA